MAKIKNASQWGSAKARERYPCGGMVERQLGGIVRGIAKAAGKTVYKIPEHMQGLPGPPSFKKPGTGEFLQPERRMMDERARGFYDRRGMENVREQTPGANMRRYFRELKREEGE